MSLYKAREWWTTACGRNEEFDARSLVIGALDSDTTQQSECFSMLKKWGGSCVGFAETVSFAR